MGQIKKKSEGERNPQCVCVGGSLNHMKAREEGKKGGRNEERKKADRKEGGWKQRTNNGGNEGRRRRKWVRIVEGQKEHCQERKTEGRPEPWEM